MTRAQADRTASPMLSLPRPTFLLYSCFLALASIALFLAFSEAHTAYLGLIWKYSTQYVLWTAVYAGMFFAAAVLLLASCLFLLRKRPYGIVPGFVGALLLTIVPAALVAFDPEHPLPLAALVFPVVLLVATTLWLVYSPHGKPNP